MYGGGDGGRGGDGDRDRERGGVRDADRTGERGFVFVAEDSVMADNIRFTFAQQVSSSATMTHFDEAFQKFIQTFFFGSRHFTLASFSCCLKKTTILY